MNASLFALALASLAASPPDVVYDFYSQNCGPCRMMMPIVHRLYAEGYAVQTVDIDQRPDLAQQYSVTQVPTFILVIGGQERQRLIGMQDESTLQALVAQIPQRQRAPSAVAESKPPRPRRSTPVRLVDDDSQSGSKFNFHLPLPSFSSRNQNQGMVQIDQPNPPTATPAQAPNNDDSAGLHNALADAGSPAAATTGDEPPREEQATNGREHQNRSAADPDVSKMLASSVRIRVRDANGVYFGSGVVIESGRGKSIVLTCGHILRDIKEESRIEVDVFDGNRSHTYPGTIVKYNLNSDLGLIAVETRFPAHVSPIASAEGGVRPGESVVSIGCSQGELPSVERLRVTMLNRYVGPDTIECSGVPGQGRSGGGLFTTRGSVVGICTNADPRDHRGVYAGLKPIHELLKVAGFEDLIPDAPRATRDSLAEVAPVKTEPAAEPSRVKVDSDMDAPPPAHLRRAPARPTEPVVAKSADEAEITPKMLEQSEVICIIRPVNQPHAASRVVVVNRASRKFMAYLTGELKDQLVPAMAHAPREKSRESDTSVTANDTVRDNRVSTTDSTQTTAVWKPTGSR